MAKQIVQAAGAAVLVMCLSCCGTEAVSLSRKTMRDIRWANMEWGPFWGIVVPNSFEMNPLLQSRSFVPNSRLPSLVVSGRRFRFGRIGKEQVIVLLTGESMLNAAAGTMLLLTLFDVKGVVHYGIAGNADPHLQIGDVTVARYWAHTGLWDWQRYGDGPENDLSLDSGGDSKKYGYLNFSDFQVPPAAAEDRSVRGAGAAAGSFLNSVWYQPEQILPVHADASEYAFWVAADDYYFELASMLEGMTLPRCADAAHCQPRNSTVVRVERGCAASTFVDNAAYRLFMRSRFNVTSIDMESSAVALVCTQLQVPFIVIRSLSDLAGGGSAQSNEAQTYEALAAQNAATVVLRFLVIYQSKHASDSATI